MLIIPTAMGVQLLAKINLANRQAGFVEKVWRSAGSLPREPTVSRLPTDCKIPVNCKITAGSASRTASPIGPGLRTTT